MKVAQLNLANFRGFEQVELTFEPDMNVIAGVNGVGKSGILQALAVLFSRALPEFTPSTARPISFTDEDIQHDKPSLEVSAICTVSGQQCHMGMQRVRGDGDKGDLWNSFWQKVPEAGSTARLMTFSEMLAVRTSTGHLEAGKAEIEHMLRMLQERLYQPLVIYFSPKRQLPGRPRNLPKLVPFEPKNAYQLALDDRDVNLREFMHWFRWQELQACKGEPRPKRMLTTLREVVKRFVPEFTGLRIEDKPALRFVVEKNGTPLALNQLSDGERGLLAVIFDITRRLAIANPTLDDPISEGEAIILIDEIELHLHPTWQRQVLRRLRNAFTSCQFIITTHSPQVIGQVQPRCLHLLEHSGQDKRIVVHHTSQSFGMDTNWILQNIMGSLARDYDTEQRLSVAYDKIDAEDLGKARELLLALEVDVGLFPDLQEAKSLLDRLELLASDATD